MTFAYQLQTAPTEEPLTLEAARSHLRDPDPADNADIENKIRGVRTTVEAYLGRGLLTQTWTYAQDAWTDVIQLPMAAPLQSVTSVQYYDTAGALTTLATSAYTVDTLHEPGRVLRASGGSWPSVQSDRRLAIQIVYVVGWTRVIDIPGNILDAVCLGLGDRHLFREGLLDGSVVVAPNYGMRRLLTNRVFWAPPPTVFE